jgi:hypothetical protein
VYKQSESEEHAFRLDECTSLVVDILVQPSNTANNVFLAAEFDQKVRQPTICKLYVGKSAAPLGVGITQY